ncbi:MAG: hypothetical protein M2R45_01260 [Verrucomicrobia subdivision 3 bacterium]|nr:hypothetical protein [Limisphaerales bacterium]MCS1415131.1 hypothetical protein [Limisphaerales bacterium]
MRIRASVQTHAFTLLEIMLAIGILSGLIAAIYASWSAILRSSQVGLDAAIEAHRLRVTTRSIEESIKSAVIFELNLPYYSFLTDTESEFAAFSLVSRLSDSFLGSGLFYDQPLRRVTFTVEHSNQVNQLMMRQHPLLAPLEEGQEPYPLVLAENIGIFALEFWDVQLNDWAPEWSYTNQFPSMIRYSLGILAPGQQAVPEDEVIRRIVHVPAATVRERWQRPAVDGAPLAQGESAANTRRLQSR